MLYTKAAALRILEGAIAVESVQLLKHCVQATYQTQRGRCSTFLSRAAFKADFVETRRAAGRSLSSRQLEPTRYLVSTPNGENHVVSLKGDRLHCDCRDYWRQLQTFRRGCCKHGYHVLETWLGLSSLAEYVESSLHRPAVGTASGDGNSPGIGQRGVGLWTGGTAIAHAGANRTTGAGLAIRPDQHLQRSALLPLRG